MLWLQLSLPLSAAQVTRPASNWGGGGCSQWVPLLLHNALCKHDSPLPNSGPCCEPKEADRSLAGQCSTPNQFPCKSCLDKCGSGGVGGSSELYILGLADTLVECQTMASAFTLNGLRCHGLTWVHDDFGPWSKKCVCGTSAASWPTTPVAAQDKVDAAYCGDTPPPPPAASFALR